MRSDGKEMQKNERMYLMVVIHETAPDDYNNFGIGELLMP